MMKIRENRSRLLIIIIALLFCLVIVTVIILGHYYRSEDKSGAVTIAVVQDDRVQDFNTNYFKKWLEKKTGYRIRFVYMQPGYEKKYLSAMLTSPYSDIDAVLFPKNKKPITEDEFRAYIRSGLIKELSGYMKADKGLSAVLKNYNLKNVLEQEYGGIYYLPNLDTSRKKRNLQVLWINMGWLKALGLQVPRTTEDLYQVLSAFRDQDPNGNGIKDELPLLSCRDDFSLQSYQYLLNAFVYNDPLHLHYYENDKGEIHLALQEENFREGLKYCSLLYKEKLLSEVGFTYNKKQLMELVNSPEDLVGAFAAQSMEDVVYANSADVIARYVFIPPLQGPDGAESAIATDYEAKIGGWIPENSTEPQKAYEIMETMLTKEASLISEYGEEAVDWEFAGSKDLSTYGDLAKVTTLNYLKDKMQNKNFAGAGPQVVSEDYIDGVAWNGDDSLMEYIDARAVKTYENYYANRHNFTGALPRVESKSLSGQAAYTEKMLVRFITGESDITSDEEWRSFCRNLRNNP